VSLWQQRALRLLRWLARMRYVKFGVVGASGTVVNMLVPFRCERPLPTRKIQWLRKSGRKSVPAA
jgi:hypothetical protein